MSTPSVLLLPASIITAALIIGASISYNATQNRYEIAAAGASYGADGDINSDIAIYRLDKASGAVTICQKARNEDRNINNRRMDCSTITPQNEGVNNFV